MQRTDTKEDTKILSCVVWQRVVPAWRTSQRTSTTPRASARTWCCSDTPRTSSAGLASTPRRRSLASSTTPSSASTQIGPQPGGFSLIFHHDEEALWASHGGCPAAEVQGHLLLTGSWDEQSPARSAGYVGSTGGDGVAAPHFGVGQPLPMRADGATPTACALRVRASSSWRPTPPFWLESRSTNGVRHGCHSFPAAGRAVPSPGWW